MSASPSSFEHYLLMSIWLSAVVLAAFSIFLLVLLAARRLLRDRLRAWQKERALGFDRTISVLLAKKIVPTPDMMPELGTHDIQPVTDVLIKYLRNISGPETRLLSDIIDIWGVEPLVCRDAKKARRGQRIQALTILSFLASETSLKAIADELTTRDPYVRLAAIRCLARRRAYEYLPQVMAAVNTDTQHNRTLLADMLQRFGLAAVKPLEDLVRIAVNDTVRAAALETLVLIAPDDTDLDLNEYMNSANVEVRSAAVSLAHIKQGGRDSSSLYRKGVADESPAVRARTVRAIASAGKPEFLQELSNLMEDEVWWVRFRASEAMLKSGPQGKAILRSVASTTSETGKMAGDILAEAGVR